MKDYDPVDGERPRKRKDDDLAGQGDLFGDARAARDAGMARALEHAGAPFSDQVSAMVRAYPSGRVCMGEDIRLEAEAQGIHPPTSKAWGGVISGLVCSQVLVSTGVYRTPRSKASHACKKPVYRRV